MRGCSPTPSQRARENPDVGSDRRDNLRAGECHTESLSQTDPSDPCDIVPDCPVCGSKFHTAHRHAKLKICVCHTCGTSLTIPDEAFDVARMRNQTKATTG